MTIRLGLALVAVLALAACSGQPQEGKLSGNTVACKLRQDFIDFQTMVAQRDERQFLATYANAMSSGKCKRYLADTDILIDKNETVDGRKYRCIRVAEEQECYWMQEP